MAQREARSRLSAAHSARVGILDALRSRSVVPNYPRPRQSLVALPRCSALSSPSSSSRAPTRSSCLRVRVPSRWRRRAKPKLLSPGSNYPTTKNIQKQPAAARSCRSSRWRRASRVRHADLPAQRQHQPGVPRGGAPEMAKTKVNNRKTLTARRKQMESKGTFLLDSYIEKKIGNVGSGKAYYWSAAARRPVGCGAPPPRADSAAHSHRGAVPCPAAAPLSSPPPPPGLRSPPPPPPPPPLLRRRAAAAPPPRAAISRLRLTRYPPPARSFRARAAWHWPFCGAWHQALAAGTPHLPIY